MPQAPLTSAEKLWILLQNGAPNIPKSLANNAGQTTNLMKGYRYSLKGDTYKFDPSIPVKTLNQIMKEKSIPVGGRSKNKTRKHKKSTMKRKH